MSRNSMPKPRRSGAKCFVVWVMTINAQAETTINLRMNSTEPKNERAKYLAHPLPVDIYALSDKLPQTAGACDLFGAK